MSLQNKLQTFHVPLSLYVCICVYIFGGIALIKLYNIPAGHLILMGVILGKTKDKKVV